MNQQMTNNHTQAKLGTDEGSKLTTPPEETPAVRPVPVPVEQKAAAKPASQEELDRVRELLLGPDLAQQRLRGAEVNRVREIIFGDQMQEYDRTFADTKRQVDRVLGDLRHMQEQMRDFEQVQMQRLETLERESRQADEELRREISRLRTVETMLQQLHAQVRQQEMLAHSGQDQVTELRKTVLQQEHELKSLRAVVDDNRIQNERKLDTLKRDTRQGADDLLAELRRVTERLNNQKTDRKALASMLIEVATRLETGTNVVGLLEGLNHTSQE
ncbi:MAG: hypothetical protein HC875_11405 [Anaerolineales bacterium]|nr:hypothetical protein [Anaerolineales bacterium]